MFLPTPISADNFRRPKYNELPVDETEVELRSQIQAPAELVVQATEPVMPISGSTKKLLWRPRVYPLLSSIVLCLTLLLCLIITYARHDNPTYGLPTISQTGMYPPESAIFSGGMTAVGALLAFSALLFSVHTRHKYETHISEGVALRPFFANASFDRMNKLCLYVGVAAAVFLILLGNLSLKDSNLVHQGFAFCFFLCALIGSMLSTHFIWRLNPLSERSPRDTFWLRWKLGFTATVWAVFALSFIVQVSLAPRDPSAETDQHRSLRQWAGALMQYTVVLCLSAYAASYWHDFKDLELAVLLPAPPQRPPLPSPV